MTIIAELLMLIGGIVAVIAAIGLVRFETPYARFHAAGKATPVAFLIAAAGASLELGWDGAAQLALAVGAMVLTLPVGVHLLFRAVHRTSNPDCLVVDELARAELSVTESVASREATRRSDPVQLPIPGLHSARAAESRTGRRRLRRPR